MTQKEFLERYKWNGAKDKIGAGGFGKIFKAKDLVRERHVAIKSAFVGDHKFTLKREVELANELEPNKNVLRYENYYRFEVSNELIDYAIMPYYEFGNLSTLIKNGKLTKKDKFEITKGILSGVYHLHKNKIVHRDLKPSNILIDRKENSWIPILADFGLSKLGVNEAESISNSSVGRSLPYAAPEQLIKDGKIGSNTDIWAIGAIIYEIFAEKRAFSSNEDNTSSVDVELFQKITKAHLPKDLNALPGIIQEIIRACLVLEPKKRADVENLIILLNAHLEREKETNADSNLDEKTLLIDQIPLVDEPLTVKRQNKASFLYLGIAALLITALLFSLKDKFVSTTSEKDSSVKIEKKGSPSSEKITLASNKEAKTRETNSNKTIETVVKSNSNNLSKKVDTETNVGNDTPVTKEANKLDENNKNAESGTGLKIATNKGAESSTFREGERVTLYYMVNRPSYIRFIYKQADGQLILLDDNLYVPSESLGKWVQTNQFVCRPPFGTENLTAFASPEPFEFLGDPGTILDLPLEAITRKAKTRGLVAERKYNVESKSIAIITEARTPN